MATKHFTISFIYHIATNKWNFSSLAPLRELNCFPENIERFQFEALFPEELVQKHKEVFREVNKNKTDYCLEYELPREGGESISITEQGAYLHIPGQWPVIAGTITLKPYELEVDASKAKRDILLARLVGGMAHDFKNLLGGIHSTIEWIIHLNENDNTVNKKEALEKTLLYTNQATALINSTLDVMSGETENNVEKLYLYDIIHDLESLVRSVLPSSIQLIVDHAVNLSPIEGNSEMLRNMLLNLVINARDAMCDDGGTLTIQLAEQDGYQTLTVRDTGCGMSKASQKNIFRALYSTKGKKGNGLGLWMVKEGVEACNGRISVESEEGKGSVFFIEFPIAKGDVKENDIVIKNDEQRQLVQQIKEINSKRKVSLLYVEDDILIRDSIANWLESLDFNLWIAKDGTEGLELFLKEQDNIDIILQDFMLPGIHGFELIDAFRSHKRDVPIILASAKNTHTSKQERSDICYLQKPFQINDLLTLILDILSTLESES